MKLYGTAPTRALRAIWLINELDIDCEIVTVDMGSGEHAGAAMRALNPAGKLPVLVDGDVVLTESCAIQLYLAEKHPEAGLIPEDAGTRAQMHRWMYFLVTEIEAPLWRMVLHGWLYPEPDRIAGDIPLAERDCRRMLQVLEAHMQGREVVVGDRLSVVDFNAAYTLDWARTAKLLDDAPHLLAFVERMYARPKAPPTIAQAFRVLRGGTDASA